MQRKSIQDTPTDFLELEKIMQIKQAEFVELQDRSLALASDAIADKLIKRRAEDDARHLRPVVTRRRDAVPITNKPSEAVSIKELESAFFFAKRMIEPWLADTELKSAYIAKRAAESIRFHDESARTRALDTARAQIAKAQHKLDLTGVPKYAQTVRALRDYAQIAEAQLKRESNIQVRDNIAGQCILHLESMIKAVKNLDKGVNGDLPSVNRSAPFEPIPRLTKIKEHLDEKIGRINANQDKRLDKLVEQNHILTQLQTKLHELPPDAALFFFNSEGLIIKTPMTKPGNLMVGVDRVEYSKTRLRPDGTFLNSAGEPVKVEMTYKVIDVPRWKNFGNGPNGAGLDRFVGDDIVGAVVIRPKEGAKPIQASKRVIVEKEVLASIGVVPEDVLPGLSFKQMAKKFGNMEFKKKETTEIPG